MGVIEKHILEMKQLKVIEGIIEQLHLLNSNQRYGTSKKELLKK